MGAAAKLIKTVAELDPREAAEALARMQRERSGWLDTFTEHLDRRRSGDTLARTLDAWNLSQSEAARLFGVSRQALGKWLQHGAPAERAEVVADLAAATDLLVHYLKRDRIPAVVRRPIGSAGNRSMLDLLRDGESAALLHTCQDMFAFERAQG